MQGMTIESFVQEAKRLRHEADTAECRFFTFLLEAEKQDFWRQTGKTFVEILEANEICRATRYIKYKRGLELAGDDAKSVGAEAVIQAGMAKTVEQAREIVEEAKIFESTNQTSISEQSAQRIRRDVRSREIGAVHGRKTYAALVEENEKLRGEVERLRTENVALKGQLRKLRGKGASKGDSPVANV